MQFGRGCLSGAEIAPFRLWLAQPEFLSRDDRGFGSTKEIYAIGAKVWVKQPNSPPIPADVITQGKDNTVLVMIPGQEKWKYGTLTRC